MPDQHSRIPEPDDLLDVARRAAAAAADVHRSRAGQLSPSDWAEKGRSDFVTAVDVEAEQRILDALLGAFPDHVVMAEESTGGDEADEWPATAPVRWIVDPLDGTTNWLHGYPEYAVSIAAEDRDGLLVGVVLNSAAGELFEATRGGGARRDGEAINVSGLSELRLALVGTGFPFKLLDVLPGYLDTLGTVLRSTAGVRRAGAAALDLCDVACGRLDAFFEYHLMPWDVAAGGLIVREAGGWFEPWAIAGLPGADTSEAAAGAERLPIGGFVAGCPGVRDAFLALLSEAARSGDGAGPD